MRVKVNRAERGAWLGAVWALAIAAAATLSGTRGAERATAADAPARAEIELLHADALDLAIRFGAEPPRPLTPREQAIRARTQQGRQEAILREIRDRRRRPLGQPMGPPPPGTPPTVRLVADSQLAPLDGTYRGELAQLLPKGLDGPPLALPSRNALIVRGEQQAIDEFGDVVRMLDVPAKSVRIQTDAVDTPVRVEEAAGVDFSAIAGEAGASLLGNAPGDANLTLRYGSGDFSGLLGVLRRESRGASQVSTSITTLSLHPAMLTAGQTVPFFNPLPSYNAFGQRSVDYEVMSLFVGVELWVLPRVNGDDTITMRLRPTIVDQTGMVAGPMGTSVPVTRQVMAETVVRVADGQTICIAGLPRHEDSVSYTFGANGPRRVRTDSNLALFVTPTIVRDAADR
jgi:type II secretory pathway component GspD/PulD (secretin)